MKVHYDPETDTLTIQFSQAPVQESDEDKPGVILDYDENGHVVSMEILNASERLDNPLGIEYSAGDRKRA